MGNPRGSAIVVLIIEVYRLKVIVLLKNLIVKEMLRIGKLNDSLKEDHY
jgi:hypothetical protein